MMTRLLFFVLTICFSLSIYASFNEYPCMFETKIEQLFLPLKPSKIIFYPFGTQEFIETFGSWKGRHLKREGFFPYAQRGHFLRHVKIPPQSGSEAHLIFYKIPDHLTFPNAPFPIKLTHGSYQSEISPFKPQFSKNEYKIWPEIFGSDVLGQFETLGDRDSHRETIATTLKAISPNATRWIHFIQAKPRHLTADFLSPQNEIVISSPLAKPHGQVIVYRDPLFRHIIHRHEFFQEVYAPNLNSTHLFESLSVQRIFLDFKPLGSRFTFNNVGRPRFPEHGYPLRFSMTVSLQKNTLSEHRILSPEELSDNPPSSVKVLLKQYKFGVPLSSIELSTPYLSLGRREVIFAKLVEIMEQRVYPPRYFKLFVDHLINTMENISTAEVKITKHTDALKEKHWKHQTNFHWDFMLKIGRHHEDKITTDYPNVDVFYFNPDGGPIDSPLNHMTIYQHPREYGTLFRTVPRNLYKYFSDAVESGATSWNDLFVNKWLYDIAIQNVLPSQRLRHIVLDLTKRMDGIKK